MLYSRAALLLTFAALARCQEEELQWPQNSTSANQGPGRYNHTLHIPLEVTDYNSLKGAELLTFNISLGTPPQNVPVAIDLYLGDVNINNMTSGFQPQGADFLGYNSSASSSAFVGEQTITITNSTPIVFDPDYPASTGTIRISRPIRRNITYSDDSSATIAGVTLPTGLNFRSFEVSDSVPNSRTPRPDDIDPTPGYYPYYTLGLGFRATAPKYFWAVQSGREPYNGRMNASVVVEDFLNQDVIRSNTYSIWRDSAEKGSPGHLLLGGLDESAYVAPLINLQTYVVNATNSPDWQAPELVVNTSFVSITPEGQEGLNLDFPSHQTIIGAGNGIFLPNNLARRMFELLGANLTVSYHWEPLNMTDSHRLSLSQGNVPCTYLTNTTTLDFRFEGTNLTIPVPISDITYQLNPASWGEDQCQLLIRASTDDESPAALGEELLRSLYRVYDLENEVISVALSRYARTTGNGTINPIPSQGGVAAMNLPNEGAGGSEGENGGAADNNTSGAMSVSVTGGSLGILSSLLGLGLVMMCL